MRWGFGGASFPVQAITVISLSHLLNHVFLEIHLALTPVFMDEFGISLFTVGVIVMIPLLCETLGTIPSGMLADRVKMVYPIVFSLLLVAASALLVSMSPNILVVVLCISMFSVARMLYHPSAYGLTSMILPVEHRSKGLGIQGSAGMVGLALGPISVGLFIAMLGWRSIYLLWVPPALLCILLIYRQRAMFLSSAVREVDESPAASTTGIKSMFSAGFVTVLVMVAFQAMGMRMISTFLSPYLVLEMGLPVSTAGFILGSITFMAIAAGPSGGFLADRFGEKRLLTVTYVGMIASLATLAYSRSMWGLAISTILYGFFLYSGTGARSSLVAHFAPATRRGMAYALYFLPTQGAGATAPLVGAYVAEKIGIWNAFPLAMVLIFVALVILQLVPHR